MNEDKGDARRSNPEAEPGRGGEDRVDARLRAVEERLVRLETRMENMATKEDIQKLKIWVLWVLGGLLGTFVISIIPIAIRVFFP